MAENWQEELIRDGTLRRKGLEDIFSDPTMNERDIAADMLVSSKFGVTSIARALTESSNPLLRQVLLTQFNASAQEHFQLSDLMENKGWYQAYASPQERLRTEAQAANKLQQNTSHKQ
jgi:similar to spore coat protein